MNWTRILIRVAVTFAVLYILGYIVPGFSGLTIPFILLIGLVTALVDALVEKTTRPVSMKSHLFILFMISSGVIYIASFIVIGRPPILSTIIAAILVALVDLVYPERVHRKPKDEIREK